jgi:prephenate dehydratase
MSHPIAIRQCVDFLDEYPQIKVVESNDTAACAKRISDEQLNRYRGHCQYTGCQTVRAG